MIRSHTLACSSPEFVIVYCCVHEAVYWSGTGVRVNTQSEIVLWFMKKKNERKKLSDDIDIGVLEGCCGSMELWRKIPAIIQGLCDEFRYKLPWKSSNYHKKLMNVNWKCVPFSKLLTEKVHYAPSNHPHSARAANLPIFNSTTNIRVHSFRNSYKENGFFLWSKHRLTLAHSPIVGVFMRFANLFSYAKKNSRSEGSSAIDDF